MKEGAERECSLERNGGSELGLNICVNIDMFRDSGPLPVVDW